MRGIKSGQLRAKSIRSSGSSSSNIDEPEVGIESDKLPDLDMEVEDGDKDENLRQGESYFCRKKWSLKSLSINLA